MHVLSTDLIPTQDVYAWRVQISNGIPLISFPMAFVFPMVLHFEQNDGHFIKNQWKSEQNGHHFVLISNGLILEFSYKNHPLVKE